MTLAPLSEPIDVDAIVSGDAAFNLAHYCLRRAAQITPEKSALEVVANLSDATPSETWTYQSIEDAVLRVAGGLLARGFQPGHRVVIRLDNTSTYPILFLGCIAAGLVAIPASSQLTAAEAQFMLADSGASAVAVASHLPRGELPPGLTLLHEDDIRTMMRAAPRAGYAVTRANDAAYLIYTSGTTAHPKGVVHAHRVVLGRRPMYQGWYAITPDDRMLHAGAFNWTYTLGTGLIDPWANGATSLIYTGEKSPEVWPALIRHCNATLFAAVPSLVRQILKYAPSGPLDVHRLRHGLIAGERPPDDLFDAWRQRTGTELHEALGMSELSTYISTKVHGNITCKMLIVDTDAMIDGGIIADDVVIRGVTRGIIRARRVRLERTAEVEGELFQEMFSAEEGAKVRGQLRELNDGQAQGHSVSLATSTVAMPPDLSPLPQSQPANTFYQRLDAARAAHATPQSPSR